MTFEELKQNYKKDLELDKTKIEYLTLEVPKRVSKYQFFFYRLLDEISETHEKIEMIYNESFLEYKQGLGKYSNFVFNATELQKMLKTDELYRAQNLKLTRLENQLKVVENMRDTISNLGYALHNKIKVMELLSIK